MTKSQHKVVEDESQTCHRGELIGGHHLTTASEEDLAGVCLMEATVDEGLAGGNLGVGLKGVRKGCLFIILVYFDNTPLRPQSS